MSYLQVGQIQNVAGVTLVPGGVGNVVDTRMCWMTEQLIVRSSSGNGILIPGLTMCIKPKKSTNVLICEWMISGETYNDNTFVIHKKVGTGSWGLITDAGQQGYNNDTGNNQWSGISAGWYDPDFNSTPQTANIQYHFVPNTTDNICLGVAIRGPNTYNNPINRTIGSSGQTSYENAVSTGMIFEIGT